jgi:UDPglucose 6-dehydrogenase
MKFPLLNAVEEVNEAQKRRLVDKVVAEFGERLAGRRFAVWGLAFKPKTDDMREAPAVAIIEGLLEGGARVSAYDPEAGKVAKGVFGDRITICERSYDAVEGADALAVVTEWNEFREPDFKKIKSLMRQPAIFDGRNIYNPRALREMGFYYQGIGQR